MNTLKLYQSDVYLKEFEAQITSVIKENDQTVITLDRSAFFPEGGGQTCDTGTIGGYDVFYVHEDERDVYHHLGSDVNLSAGDTVSCVIDWKRRFDNMQRHCGEHVLTGIIYREFGGVNRGFHMGEEYMTIDISMEENPEYPKLTWEMLLKAEALTNEVIWENVPMITRHFNTLAEAEKVPVRKKVVVEEDITLVGIGSPENGWGTCACCGTHPAFTGQVGLVKVFKVEPNKGMFRVYFEAGKRAMEDYSRRFDIITQLGQKYSAGVEDLLDKMEAQEEKQKELRTKYSELRQSVISSKAEMLKDEIGDGSVHAYAFDDLTLDDVRNMAKKLDFTDSRLTIFMDRATNTCLLFSSGKNDCGKLIKDNAPVFGGKGGGRKDQAQAKFPDLQSMELFADAAEKILR